MNKAFIFPGQGSQFVGMGKELYENFPVAKYVYQEVDDAIDFNLSKIILEGPEDELTKTENTQPALMANSIAILRVIENLTKKNFHQLCDITAGHSLGQYSAMCGAGILSLRDCAYILKLRGKFMQNSGSNSKGSMAAVIGAENDLLEKILKESSKIGICELANDNSSDQKVISGEDVAIDFAISKCKEFGIKVVKLKVSAAFHSSLMIKASEEMKNVLEEYDFLDSQTPIIDNVTTEITCSGKFLKNSLVNQIPGTVRWRETMDIISIKPVDYVFEIGPGKTLTNLMKKNHSSISSNEVSSLSEIEGFCKLVLE